MLSARTYTVIYVYKYTQITLLKYTLLFSYNIMFHKDLIISSGEMIVSINNTLVLMTTYPWNNLYIGT